MARYPIFFFCVAAGLSNPNMDDLICSSHQLYFMVSPGTMNSQKGTRMGQDTLKDFITSMFQLCFPLLRPSSNLFCSRVKSCDSFCLYIFILIFINNFIFLSSSVFPVNILPLLFTHSELGDLPLPFHFYSPQCVCVGVWMCVCVYVLPCGWRLQSALLRQLQWRTVTTRFTRHQTSMTPVPVPLIQMRTRYQRTKSSLPYLLSIDHVRPLCLC